MNKPFPTNHFKSFFPTNCWDKRAENKSKPIAKPKLKRVLLTEKDKYPAKIPVKVCTPTEILELFKSILKPISSYASSFFFSFLIYGFSSFFFFSFFHKAYYILKARI